MIDRYDPFFTRGMGLRQVMDRLLEDAFVMPRGERGSTELEGIGSAPVNVYEEGDNLVVEAQLPGMKAEDIEVQHEQGVLTLSGQHSEEQERHERNYLVREHRTGRFSRSLRLPGSYNAEACQATFNNGVLRVTFPKAEEAKPKRITVEGGSGGPQVIEGEAQHPR